MNNNFNITRIKWLLKADWIEYKKSFLLGMGVLLLVWLTILFLGNPQKKDVGAQAAYFVAGGLITFIFYCRHVGRKVHKSLQTYLTIPASTIEKYTCLLLEGLIYFTCYLLLFYLGLLLWQIGKTDTAIFNLQDIFFKNGSESGLLFLTALIFLSYITFRKHAFLIATGSIALYLGLIFGVLLKVIMQVAKSYEHYFDTTFFYDALTCITKLYTPVMLISTLVIMYISYLKLKEKELR